MRPLIKASRLFAIAAVALLLALTGCKSKNLPTYPTAPSIPTPSTPSTGGMPPPPSGGLPSIPSTPSTPSPSKPSTPSDGAKSGSSPPSLPSAGMPSSGPSGKPEKSGKKSDQKSGQKPGGEQAGDPSSGEAGDQRAAQTAAGDDLQKAGERIAKAGSGEIDPLIPETDSDSSDDGDVFADSNAASGAPMNESAESSGADGADGQDDGQESSAGGGQGQMNENGAASEQVDGMPGGGIPGDLADEILAAQVALAEAGGALQTAGAAVAGAETDEELASAEELLSDARIAVIIASQDIEILEGELAGTPGWGDSDDNPFQETSAALQEANIALVIATRAVLIAKTGSAELSSRMPNGVPGGGETQTSNGQVTVLEGELDESLIIFDGQIGDAREAVLSTTPPPTTNPTGIQRPEGERMRLPTESEMPQTIEKPSEQQVATANMPDLNQGDIPDPQGDDIVAQQLREAAIAESDPELQAKLWEEYKRYREGL
jgi:hypothetical protein